MKPDKLKRSRRRFRWYFEQGSNSSPKLKWAFINPILNKLSFKLTQLLILLLVGYNSHFICVVIPQALRFPFNRPSNVCSSRLGHSNFGREKKTNLRPQCNSNKLIINCLIWCVTKGWGWGERGDFHLCYHLIAGRLLWILQIYIGCWLKRKHCVDFYEASVRGNKSCPFWAMYPEWEYLLLDSLDKELELPRAEESCQRRGKKIKQLKRANILSTKSLG